MVTTALGNHDRGSGTNAEPLPRVHLFPGLFLDVIVYSLC